MMEAAVVGLVEVRLELQELEAADRILSSYSSFKSNNDASLLFSAARGRLLHLQGKLDQAQALLEVASTQSTDPKEKSYLALVQRRLAAVYWDLGGEFRSKKAYCVPLLLAAAKANPCDACVFAQLGQWYLNAQDIGRAEKCLLKALTLDAACALAGESLSVLYTAHGETERNTRLWVDMAAASVHATWAHLRLAQHFLNMANEAAISTMHTVLRQAPHHAPHWAALGHVYACFGRIMAAQKSYLKVYMYMCVSVTLLFSEHYFTLITYRQCRLVLKLIHLFCVNLRVLNCRWGNLKRRFCICGWPSMLKAVISQSRNCWRMRCYNMQKPSALKVSTVGQHYIYARRRYSCNRIA